MSRARRACSSFVFESFDSPAALLAAAESRPINHVWEGERRSSRKCGGADWSGASSWSDAVEVARLGYPDAVERCKASTGRAVKLAERVSAAPARPVRSVVGGSPCVARAMMGCPDSMRRVTRERRKVSGVSLVFDLGAHCGVAAGELIDYGARAVALVKLLERAGIPCRLSASWAACGSKQLVCCDVLLRDFGRPLNLSKVAFWLAHPAAMRRVMFGWLESSPLVSDSSLPDGYGWPVSNPERGAERDQLRDHYIAGGGRWLNFSDLRKDADVLTLFESFTV